MPSAPDFKLFGTNNQLSANLELQFVQGSVSLSNVYEFLILGADNTGKVFFATPIKLFVCALEPIDQTIEEQTVGMWHVMASSSAPEMLYKTTDLRKLFDFKKGYNCYLPTVPFENRITQIEFLNSDSQPITTADPVYNMIEVIGTQPAVGLKISSSGATRQENFRIKVTTSIFEGHGGYPHSVISSIVLKQPDGCSNFGIELEPNAIWDFKSESATSLPYIYLNVSELFAWHTYGTTPKKYHAPSMSYNLYLK